MSNKARKLIKEAVKAHIKDDGAGNLGAYRDVITEVLHLAYKDPLINKKKKKDYSFRCYLKEAFLNEGFDMFEEEITNNEIKKICAIPKEDLPTYINHEWETEEGLKQYQQLLRERK